MEALISASTVLTITFPTSAALAATELDAATLTMMERMLAVRSMGDPLRLLFSSAARLAGTSQAGISPGATSLAARETLPAAVTLEPPANLAETVLATAFPMAETWMAAEPDPATPRARERMIAADSALKARALAVDTVEPVISASTVLTMALVDRATPTAALPLPDTPNARESMVELSRADTVVAPPASTR